MKDIINKALFIAAQTAIFAIFKYFFGFELAVLFALAIIAANTTKNS
jgi:hypothetical protein